MKTTDVGFASYIYSLGKDVEIQYLDARYCVFCFEDCPELKEWQSGQAIVNGLVLLNSYKALVRKVKNEVKI